MPQITAQTASTQRIVLAIKDRLAETRINEIARHDDLIVIVPTSLQKLYYVLTQRAQRLLNAECGAVFATVRKEGYRRLSNGTGAEYASNTALVRIRSQSRKGQKVATMAIRFANDITNSDKRRVYQKLASLGLIEHLTMAKTVRTMPDGPVQAPADPLSGLREMLDSVIPAK